MLKNYTKIAFRNLTKQKIYSTINILGLATGLAGATTTFLAAKAAVANPVDSLRYE